jgi:hypothetical protein
MGEGEKVKDKRYKIGLKVEPHGEFADGRTFPGFPEFQQLLQTDPERVARGIATKLLVYGTGRRITLADRATIDAVVTAAKPQNYGLRSMIHGVVESDLFQQP